MDANWWWLAAFVAGAAAYVSSVMLQARANPASRVPSNADTEASAFAQRVLRAIGFFGIMLPGILIGLSLGLWHGMAVMVAGWIPPILATWIVNRSPTDG